VQEPRRIQQLSPSLVNRIAAGEVIERPAAVVKELVENALDAGAASIVVEAEDGGRAAIRVIDDGAGIPPEDLLLAFAAHATSKLSSDEDLFRISTLGFRGEALASIGSVSHARILSRTAASEAAYELQNRGGELGDVQAAAGNAGTVVEVRNLFFNTPARRKFIKGTATEFGHISETVLRLALPHPRVAFRLLHNGRVALDLPAAEPNERLLAAWPKEFHDLRLSVDAGDVEVHLRGMVGLPELSRPTARYQYLYLNGRHIRDRYIQHALREAYRGLTEPGRHPAAVLMLEMPPGDVDVNVHPTKAEVRFRDGGRVHGLVMSAVREKLLGSDLTPLAAPRSAQDDLPQQELRQKLAAFFKQQLPAEAIATMTPPGEPQLPMMTPAGVGPPAGSSPQVPAMDWAARPVPASATNEFSLPSRRSFLPQDGQGYSGSSLDDASHAPPSAPAQPVSPANPAAVSVPAMSPSNPSNAAAPPAIQLHNSYLVAQSDDGLVIIDQHALHERIMYEELLARVSRGPLESQRLLIPQVIEASANQIAMLEQVQTLLGRLGIEVSPFGPGTVAVHAFPSFLGRLDPLEFVCELLERGEQELLDMHEEEMLHEVLDMMACKAAVKAGDPLSAAEIEALLARREGVERASNCPHGRPTTLRLSLRDLEKQFKRTGF
jgi:DNA mismatch repair protein MutL